MMPPLTAGFGEGDAGVNVFRLLNVPEAEMISPERRDELAAQLRVPIRSRLGLTP